MCTDNSHANYFDLWRETEENMQKSFCVVSSRPQKTRRCGSVCQICQAAFHFGISWIDGETNGSLEAFHVLWH